ncbi:hypothetical protein GobsT_17220 [Gemmata obscuriglobus]|nr:hypothetical protein GobsT_17220 [Gemmata obscuriglobus]VTS03212.1 unnamed protein product [Gemmata obscuriglobus UQM 2246]
MCNSLSTGRSVLAAAWARVKTSAVERCCRVAVAWAAVAWQSCRMVLSSNSQPTTSARVTSALAKDCWTPSKTAIRQAPGVT